MGLANDVAKARMIGGRGIEYLRGVARPDG